MKECGDCGETLPLSSFYKRTGSDCPRNYCKKCWAKRCRPAGRKYDASREAGSKRQTHKARRDYSLRRDFGITSAEYDAIETAQNFLCAICERPETIMRHGRLCRLAVDHDHKTGKVRALLCNRCNLLLGKVHDNPEILRQAVGYLDRFKEGGLTDALHFGCYDGTA